MQEFGRALEPSLPGWGLALRKAATIAPTSASVERVFSHMRAIFPKGRSGTLQDAMELGLMARLNFKGYSDPVIVD